jgi:hypothetical protein
LIRKTAGGAVYELDDPYSKSSMRQFATEGEKHLRLTPGQKDVLDEARAILAKSDGEPSPSA